MTKNIELKDFPDIVMPRWLPKALQLKLTELKNCFEYAKTNPYFSYYFINHKNPYLQRLAKEKMDEDKWNEYKYRLNRQLNSFPLLYDERMKAVWDKVEKAQSGLSVNLFMNFNNKYNQIAGNDWFGFNPKDDMRVKHLEKYLELSKNPSSIIAHLMCIKSIFEEYMTIIAPDGSDCFNDIDKTDPENKIHLDENGEVPFVKNMDFYISDDEYDMFMELLDKITVKLIKRLENNIKNERKELNNFLINPKSRKSNIRNAKIIEFTRDIYLVFLRFVGKPCYAEIVIIIAVLFDELYDVDNIKKWTSKTKNKYNKLKDIVKKQGVSLDDEYSAERMFFKRKGNIQS